MFSRMRSLNNNRASASAPPSAWACIVSRPPRGHSGTPRAGLHKAVGQDLVMAETILRDYPALRQFVLSTVTLTGARIGAGAYGSVEEVAIPGAICAAKKIRFLP